MICHDTEPAETPVRVYFADVADFSDLNIEAARWLTLEELRRAEKFIRAQPRAEFLLARLLLRRFLHRLASEVARTELAIAERGKPFLPGAHLHFNLAHSGGRVALALCRDAPVGVDLERCDAGRDFASLKRAALCKEEHKLDQSEKHTDFFRRWCLKEALLKATGDGLTKSMTDFAVVWRDRRPAFIGANLPPNAADFHEDGEFAFAACRLGARQGGFSWRRLKDSDDLERATRDEEEERAKCGLKIAALW
jgi:4'-phosphopantetheinyl transferase